MNRLIALAIVAGTEYVSTLILPFVPRNDFYYAACAVMNNVQLILVLSLLTPTKLGYHLSVLIFSQMVFQFFGWVIYQMRLPIEIYNWSIHIIVFATFLRILLAGFIDGNSPRPASRGIHALDDHLERKQDPGVLP